MKKNIVFYLLVFAPSLFAQNFMEKTNAIHYNYTQPVVATTLPSIAWTSPKVESTASSEESTRIKVAIKSDIALKEIVLEISNGGQVTAKPFTIGENEFQKDIDQALHLVPGDNTIRLIVRNTLGAEVSSKRSILSGKEALADAVDANRKDYALLFATDEYDHWNDLSNPVFDAETISQTLKDRYGFEIEVVKNATNTEMLEKIFEYNTRKFNRQDQLFVFFAGHGSYDQTLDEGYVVASNSELNDKSRASYISHILIRERLNNIKCEHIFLVMDVCFGGTLDPSMANVRAQEDMDEMADKNYLVQKLSRPTRKFLTSGGKEYVPDGTPGSHSPFATKFIQALKETGGGRGNMLSLIELRTYFQKLSTQPRFGGFGRDDSQSDFVFVAKQ